MTKAYLLTICCVTTECFGLEPDERAVWLGKDYAVCALDLDEALSVGGLNEILAIPPAVRVGVPEWRALADWDDNPPQGAVAGDEKDVEFFGLPEHDRGGREDLCGEVEAEGWDVGREGDELEHETLVGYAQENGACEGRVEEGGEGRVFEWVARLISRRELWDVLLGRVDRNGLRGWEEGGEMGRDEETGLHESARNWNDEVRGQEARTWTSSYGDRASGECAR